MPACGVYPRAGRVSTLVDSLSCGVQTIVGNKGAFAAVKVDGSVVTWGSASCGGTGNFSRVAAQLEFRRR